MRLIYIIIILGMVVGRILHADSIESTSPNGHYAVYIVDKKNDNLIIYDNKTKKSQSTTALMPIISLKWTKDCKSLVTIEHIASGSMSSVLSMESGGLRHFAAFPPDNGEFCSVVRQVIGWSKVKITYRVCSSRKGPFWTCEFTVDAKNGAISDKVTKLIDIDTYRALSP